MELIKLAEFYEIMETKEAILIDTIKKELYKLITKVMSNDLLSYEIIYDNISRSFQVNIYKDTILLSALLISLNITKIEVIKLFIKEKQHLSKYLTPVTV
jgi:hypothetical protein